MLTKNIEFENFKKFKKNYLVLKIFKNLKKNIKKNSLLSSLSSKYKYSFNLNQFNRYKKYNFFRVIGMGGSILGAQAIYSFLNFKIKKKFEFINNLNIKKNLEIDQKKLNIIISKSGNTLETISNFNTLKENKESIFITGKNDNYLNKIAKKMKREVFEHKDFIGGRFSVLSETGMLPACLMGLNLKKFKRFNSLINNETFFNQLVLNVSGILNLYKSKKTNSIILNYDENSQDFFYWYQQLVAESLGKKSGGILPLISLMPRDNHSLMQLYLDGRKNNFFTFFMVKEKSNKKIRSKYLLDTYSLLKNKTVEQVIKSEFYATQKVFIKKKIPFRSFVINNRSEETLGELFTFFILETILLGKALNINPFNQPEVELIKKETNKILKKI
tara:strand:+ start:2953 stop:4116 length:1164 start_codon:yes stop_codon:yes gene_type:complete